MSERVTKHGIDVNGHAYTRQVNPERTRPAGTKSLAAPTAPVAAVEDPEQSEEPSADHAALQAGSISHPEPASEVQGFPGISDKHRTMWSNRIINGTDSGEDSVALARSLDENVGTLNAVLSSCLNGRHREQTREALESLATAAVATKTQDSYPHVVAAQAYLTWMLNEPEERVRHWLDQVPADNFLGQELRGALKEDVKRDPRMFRGVRTVL